VSHGAEFLRQSRHFLAEDYLPRTVAVLRQLGDEDIWWRGNEASNSIGNLVLHLCGNVRQWIVSGVGSGADVRDRPSEFARRDGLSRDELIGLLEHTIADVDAVLARVMPAQLDEPRRIQGIETTVMGAIYHVVEHFSGHVGQIVLLGKLRLARDLGFWQIEADGSARAMYRAERRRGGGAEGG
jgi:uncharacterized damage-inducible protein DinB